MPSNNIAFARNYTSVIDEVYQRASVSGVLNSGRRMVRAGRNVKMIRTLKSERTGFVFRGGIGCCAVVAIMRGGLNLQMGG